MILPMNGHSMKLEGTEPQKILTAHPSKPDFSFAALWPGDNKISLVMAEQKQVKKGKCSEKDMIRN
jgi:hypothetical protein